MKTKIESLLFVSHKPLSPKDLIRFFKKTGIDFSDEEVEKGLEDLMEKYNQPGNGINIIKSGEKYQMVSAAESAEEVKKFLKDDTSGELTPASLETLTVIAYKGPISKPELEQIRGVNCSLILRNLLIRGLIDFEEKSVHNLYQITPKFLKYLGMNSVKELPDYEKLSQVENLEQYQEKQDQSNS